MKHSTSIVSILMICITAISFGQTKDSTATDTVKKATKELPLEPSRKIEFKTNEGTWVSVDVSPDGQKIAFDMMGDIYEMPISGGTASRITSGIPYDVHPRYSPDGKSILYISDKSGSDNIWIKELNSKEDDTQLTKSSNQHYFSADWSPDGEYIVGTHGRRNIKPYLYHKDGGGGAQLIKEPKNLKTIDPAFSADGNTIYFSKRTSAWNYNAQLPQYRIMSFDREDGSTFTISSRYGSSFTPTLSNNGKWMVYGSRFEEKTGLILRNLISGKERWLAYPIQRDEQESIAPLGVLPAMAFTPDSKNLIASYGGKIYSISIENNKATNIPFEVDVALDLGPQLDFSYPIEDSEQALVTQIRDAVASPDGSQLAFTALNRLYVMNFSDSIPKRITQNDFVEAMPTWSPDGNSLVFTTWKHGGGHLFRVDFGKKNWKIKQLTNEPGFYFNPAWSYQSNRIAFIKGSAQAQDDAIDMLSSRSFENLAWMDANGGSIHIIDETKGRDNPHFTTTDNRLYLNHGTKGLISIRWDGTDEKEHLKLTGIKTYGSSDVFGKEHSVSILPSSENARENNTASRPSEIKISPDGKKALAKINNDIYSVLIPKIGKTPSISLAKADKAAFPADKLTIMGGEFPHWSSNSDQVNWSLGSSYFSFDLSAHQKHKDSLELEEKKKKEAAKNKDEKDEDDKKDADDKKEEDNRFKADEFKVNVSYKRAIPKGYTLLQGGRIITMENDEVIENGDILIKDNRIQAIGKSGSLDVPATTKIIDVKGKTITPGFIDTHAHMWPNWSLHKNQVWIYSANLAYGVTTTRDPQTATTDVLTYSDMVEAGMIHGPRVYSTGPGVGYWQYKIESLDHTKDILKQYSDYYHTKYIKMYLVGNRQQRQWVIMASKELGLLPTTEGGLDFKSNMKNMIDGYPGHEHSLPIYPIYKDVIQTAAESQMAITPTLLVSYGGPWAENYYYSRENPYHDAKMQFFTPYDELAPKSRRRPGWFMDEEHVFKKHAEFMNDLVKAGGIAGVGSHGQLQGLGLHWELWSIASGGMSTMNALKTATILGAKALGFEKDLGSITNGKLADLLIMNHNPLDTIRNTNTLKYVVKNGLIYDADTLDEIAPVAKKAPVYHWQTKRPKGLPGIE